MEYEDHEGWSEDITGVRESSALPAAAREYVEWVTEAYTSTSRLMHEAGIVRE